MLIVRPAALQVPAQVQAAALASLDDAVAQELHVRDALARGHAGGQPVRILRARCRRRLPVRCSTRSFRRRRGLEPARARRGGAWRRGDVRRAEHLRGAPVAERLARPSRARARYCVALFGRSAPSCTVVSRLRPRSLAPLPVSDVNAWLDDTWNSYTRPPTAALLGRRCGRATSAARDEATSLLTGESRRRRRDDRLRQDLELRGQVRARCSRRPPRGRASSRCCPIASAIDHARWSAAARRHRRRAPNTFVVKALSVATSNVYVSGRTPLRRRVLDRQLDRLLRVLELGAHRRFEQARRRDVDAGNRAGDRGAQRGLALLGLAADQARTAKQQTRLPRVTSVARFMVPVPVGRSALPRRVAVRQGGPPADSRDDTDYRSASGLVGSDGWKSGVRSLQARWRPSERPASEARCAGRGRAAGAGAVRWLGVERTSSAFRR